MIENLPDAITQVVTDMQAESVSSRDHTANDSSFTYNYITENNIFVAGMYVEILPTFENVRYKIDTFTKNSRNSYTITFVGDFSILEGSDGSIEIRPFILFKYDSYKNIQKRILEESKGTVTKNNKYPLLVLAMPYKETRERENEIIFETVVSMALIIDSQKHYTTAERLTYSFKQKLHPLYNLFIDKLKLCGLFQMDENYNIPHEKEDLYFWSADPAQTQNKISAIVDAIEINNLQLILNKQ